MIFSSYSESDLFRPCFLHSLGISLYSKLIWAPLYFPRRRSLPVSCSNLASLIQGAPTIPQSPEVLETSDSYSLYIGGYSKWSITADNECTIFPVKKASPRRVNIGVSQPSSCDLSAAQFPEWTGFGCLPKSSSNYLSILVLGWSFVLSARLVELRRATSTDKTIYTDNKAPYDSDDTNTSQSFSIDIGSHNEREIRWWAAVLAPGCGWQATLARNGKKYYPPWQCHLKKDISFKIKYTLPLNLHSRASPPSSAEAQNFLYNFARYHNCFDQLLAAFITNITLPQHWTFGAPIILPQPKHNCSEISLSTEAAYAPLLPSPNEIQQFMMVSCLSDFVTSCLASCFWEQGVNCNIASEWLNTPLKHMIPSLIQGNKFGHIIHTMSHRRPRIASLWLASTISCLLPRMCQVFRAHISPVCLEAAAWTCSPQSFIHPVYHRPVQIHRVNGKDMISRQDEFRLLFLTDTESEFYGGPPSSPYPPFGFVNLEDSSLDVRLHASCGHRLSYHSWEWISQNGQSINDRGLGYAVEQDHGCGLGLIRIAAGIVALLTTSTVFKLKSRILFPGLLLFVSSMGFVYSHTDHDLSARATCNIFSWILFKDGTRIDDRQYWKHEWLSFLLQHNHDNTLSSTSLSTLEHPDRGSYIRQWRQVIST